MSLSVVILSRRDEDPSNAIRSVSYADEIILIIDSQEAHTTTTSGDNIKTFFRKIDADFSAQRNFALSKATKDWAFFLDCDEIFTPELMEEIRRTIENTDKNGYFIKRRDSFLGRQLKHGETSSVKLLRLARRNAGEWKGKVHEKWEINGPVGFLSSPLIHDRKLTVAQFLDRINSYTTIQAEDMFDKKVREPLAYHLFKPILKFLHNYVLRVGFLDGLPGIAMAFLMSWHSLLVRIKLYLKYLPNK